MGSNGIAYDLELLNSLRVLGVLCVASSQVLVFVRTFPAKAQRSKEKEIASNVSRKGAKEQRERNSLERFPQRRKGAKRKK
jgi:hypothetical protein